MNQWVRPGIVLATLAAGAYVLAVIENLLRFGPTLAVLGAPLQQTLSVLRSRDLVPNGRDRTLFTAAPMLAVVVVILCGLFVPLSPRLVAFDISLGLFYFLVFLALFVITLMNAGWSANSKTGLFGVFRAASHLVSYEVPIGFAAIGPVMAAESLRPTTIVQAQSQLWFVVWQPLGLAIYLFAALFASYARPFDLPQAGSEIGGGVLADYSGPRLLLLRFGQRALFLLLMAMGVVLFFGGWQGPLVPRPVWFAAKTFALATCVMWSARFFPRLRHDQMLAFAWKVLVPASLVNIMAVGMIVLLAK